MDNRSSRDVVKHNIKYYRLQNKLTQKELAKITGIKKKYISDVERGIFAPDYDQVDIIARVLGIDSYMLFKDDYLRLDIPNRLDEITHKRNTNKDK